MLSGTNRPSNKLLGRYYTPIRVAKSLTDWAIADSDARVFDPSFGGCAFYEASLRTLSRRGAKKAGRHLYGVDVDPSARAHLESTLEAGGRDTNFKTADFLTLDPADFGGGFDAVVGNPPYVRHHALSQKPNVTLDIGGRGVRVPRSSSYWVYFLLHALRFLKPQGRLAFVLPGSFLYADYSQVARQVLLAHFATVYVLIVEERLFSEADELSVVVLGEGRANKEGRLRMGYVSTAEDLGRTLQNVEGVTASVGGHTDVSWNSYRIEPWIVKRLTELIEAKALKRLGELAEVRIGTVTGCNKFFLLNAAEAKHLRVPSEFLFPFFSGFSSVTGLRFGKSNYLRPPRSSEACFLLDINDEEEMTGTVKDYVACAERAGIDRRVKCRARDPWFMFDNIEVPDAFLSCMCSDRVRVVDNVVGAASTNSIHGIYWKKDVGQHTRKAIIASSISTLFQLSAEIGGRCYGGGLLKLEPGDALGLLVTQTGCTELFDQIDSALSRGNLGNATSIADRACARALKLSANELEGIRAALKRLRGSRLGTLRQSEE